MADEAQIEAAKTHFGKILEEQLARVERLKQQPDWLDFSRIKPIKIGMIGGDGIGPTIAIESQKVLEYLLRDQVKSGKVEFRTIEGLTIENRAARLKSIPEDMYAVGSQGLNVTDDLALDFRVITSQGSERIIDAAFAHAKRTGKDSVTIVTKANIVKTTDGKFLDMARRVSQRYPGIKWEGWYIDIMTAALINPARQKQFQVLALPNLYGDILTDEAAQIQGGVGTAGSANIGKVYAMFEAIHGSAPRMVTEGRAQYADPSSMIRAGGMLLEHIGFPELGARLHKALDVCGQYERRVVMTGRSNGATSAQFGEYLMQTVEDPDLEAKWEAYV